MTFGERLLKELELRGMSQRELARHLGLTPQAVTNWVSAHSRPSRANLICTEDILDLPRGELLAMFGYRHPDEDPAAEVTPEQAIRRDPGMFPEDKRSLLHLIAGLRQVFARTTNTPPAEVVALYTPNLDDVNERAIWALDLPEATKWQLILDVREAAGEREASNGG